MKAQLKKTVVMSLAVLSLGLNSISNANAQQKNKKKVVTKQKVVKQKKVNKKAAPAPKQYPKAGHRTAVVPKGASRVQHGGKTYYVTNGVYYSLMSGRQYQVVNPPAGLYLNNLPAGYTTVNRNGMVYYHHNGHYYKKQNQTNGAIVFQIVLF